MYTLTLRSYTNQTASPDHVDAVNATQHFLYTADLEGNMLFADSTKALALLGLATVVGIVVAVIVKFLSYRISDARFSSVDTRSDNIRGPFNRHHKFSLLLWCCCDVYAAIPHRIFRTLCFLCILVGAILTHGSVVMPSPDDCGGWYAGLFMWAYTFYIVYTIDQFTAQMMAHAAFIYRLGGHTSMPESQDQLNTVYNHAKECDEYVESSWPVSLRTLGMAFLPFLTMLIYFYSSPVPSHDVAVYTQGPLLRPETYHCYIGINGYMARIVVNVYFVIMIGMLPRLYGLTYNAVFKVHAVVNTSAVLQMRIVAPVVILLIDSIAIITMSHGSQQYISVFGCFVTTQLAVLAMVETYKLIYVATCDNGSPMQLVWRYIGPYAPMQSCIYYVQTLEDGQSVDEEGRMSDQILTFADLTGSSYLGQVDTRILRLEEGDSDGFVIQGSSADEISSDEDRSLFPGRQDEETRAIQEAVAHVETDLSGLFTKSQIETALKKSGNTAVSEARMQQTAELIDVLREHGGAIYKRDTFATRAFVLLVESTNQTEAFDLMFYLSRIIVAYKSMLNTTNEFPRADQETQEKLRVTPEQIMMTLSDLQSRYVSENSAIMRTQVAKKYFIAPMVTEIQGLAELVSDKEASVQKSLQDICNIVTQRFTAMAQAFLMHHDAFWVS